MPSVFSLLLDTLPFTVATRAAARQAGVSIDQLSAQDLWPYLRLISNTDNYTVPAPPAPGGNAADPAGQQLWSWQHAASAPHRITNVDARVRDTGYKNHRVLDSIEIGTQEMAGPFAPASRPFQSSIEIRDHNGRTVDLPLSSQYLHSKWLVTGGWMPPHSHWLWPLETFVDSSLVLAFTYELTVVDATSEVNAMTPQSVRTYAPDAADPGEQEIRNYAQRGAAAGWVERARGGEFFIRAARGEVESSAPLFGQSSPIVSTGRSVTLLSGFPRILVVVSLTTCRERNDFEPGGIVGMGRLYPHVMLIADVPLRQARTTIRLTRPQSTTVLDQGNGSVPGTCCHAHSPMASLLVTDSNENPAPGRLTFLPFWSGAFAYYEADPNVRLGDRAMHVVRRDRPRVRTVRNAGTRTLPTLGLELTDIIKVPRQGEWDNVHMAPRLQLPAAEAQVSLVRMRITPSRWRLDPIMMAPFCSHDCFHLHWRWSTTDDEEWVLGWGGVGLARPHQVPGWPMVPPNQDVYIETPAANVLTYHAIAHPTSDPLDNASRHIEAGHWQVFMHHGGAYAQGIVRWRQSAVRRIMATMSYVRSSGADAVRFFNASGQPMDFVDEPATLYWNLRYYVDGNGTDENGYVVRDRLGISTSDVDRARLA